MSATIFAGYRETKATIPLSIYFPLFPAPSDAPSCSICAAAVGTERSSKPPSLELLRPPADATEDHAETRRSNTRDHRAPPQPVRLLLDLQDHGSHRAADHRAAAGVFSVAGELSPLFYF
jgi:hypothetical protein